MIETTMMMSLPTSIVEMALFHSVCPLGKAPYQELPGFSEKVIWPQEKMLLIVYMRWKIIYLLQSAVAALS